MSADWPRIVEAVKNSVVRVRSRLLGTGFLTEGGLFVTALHVVASSNVIQLETSDGDKAEARLSNYPSLASIDVGVLESPIASGLPTLPLGNLLNARVGEEVLFAGYPLDETMPLTFHRAMIAFIGHRSFPFMKQEVACLQLDGSVNLGNSGGPVINEEGEVLGIVNARYGRITDFLEAFLREQAESRQVLAQIGLRGGFEAGVVEMDGKRYKQFDTQDAQNALIDIVTMLRNYTNVGIGWAISSTYISDAIKP